LYLKSLEIQGFKSFPDKTVICFGSDITAIVGPNGSGKSNISDAISWVLGEQSTKALRGAKMEDVIFGGTQKRAQVGFAEASLILDNTDGALRIENAEVMVTRRYYRSGESEYYINRQTARLRDINELFMDTGLGREGYSNIGQGRIDEILSVKSTDRREVFEEAAGISKYRHRKEETERRLANTADNLLRIGDKITELELQVGPLREQAEKAEKYLALRGELRGYEVTVWLDSLEKLAAAAKKAEEDYSSAAFILEQEHQNLDSLYRLAEQLGGTLHEQDQKLDAVRETIAGLEDEARRCDGELGVLRNNMDNNSGNIERIRTELLDQQNRSGGIEAQAQEKLARIAELEAGREAAVRRLSALNDEAAALSAQAERDARQLSGLRDEQSGLNAATAAAQTERSSLELSMDEFSLRREELRRAAADAAEKLTAADAQTADCEKRLHAAHEDVTSAGNTISGYELRRKARVSKRDELQKQASAAGVELETALSKLHMLREMEREFEGFSKAVRIVMQEAGRGALGGVHGPVSKLLHAEDQYTVSIETALGASMQHIVVTGEQNGKEAINLLKRRDGGRATFLPLTAIRGRRLEENGLERCEGFVGVASDLIRYDEKYESVFLNLLGRTVICDNLDHAIAMARSYQNRFRIVTLDGQVMNAGGSMTGGSVTRSAGILSRANELERLTAAAEALRDKKMKLEARLAEAVRSASEVEFELTAVQDQLRQAQDEVLRLEGSAKQCELLVDAAKARQESCGRERSLLESRETDSAVRRKALDAKLDSLREKSAALAEQLARAETAAEQTGAARAALQETISARRAEDAAAEAECATARESVAQLQKLAEAMRGDHTSKEAVITGLERENKRLAGEIETTQAARDALNGRIDAEKQSLRAALEDRMRFEARKTKAEKDAQDKNKDILLLERESARLEQKKATSAMEEKQILDKLWDTYELTPGTAAAEKIELESHTAANREITTLKRKISALGTPNLGAIDEFSRVNERYEYLTGQRDDVLHAKKELEEIVRSITTEMTEIFVREFARINEHFGRTFVEMFGGGKASLELDDPDDPLSCGIEIRVQPPGKQLKTITLLSGGEKAFVAIALYFAILRVRPTPFCLLDEIDAALDDSNVRRFAEYLRNLCDKTQFIVITHRRGTMEQADMLYGVTMQEEGISTILHIDLNQMQQQLGIK